jgi:hypothetical protein
LAGPHKELSHQLSLWIRNLANALGELDSGVVLPVLQPAAVANRRPFPAAVWDTRAYVALGIRAMKLSGLPTEDAARRAVRQVKAIKGTPVKSVISWHTQFVKRRVKSEGAARAFRFGCIQIKDEYQSYEQYAERFWRLADVHATGELTPHS